MFDLTLFMYKDILSQVSLGNPHSTVISCMSLKYFAELQITVMCNTALTISYHKFAEVICVNPLPLL